MAAPKRTRFQRELDLARIAAMYLDQKTQTEIGQELSLSQAVVNRDLQEVNRRWRESALIDLNEAKARELARIDLLEREYWQAWERSQEDMIKTHSARGDREGDRVSMTREHRDGNPAFLAGVQWCIEQRCKILGLYEAARNMYDWRSAVEAQGLDAAEVFEEMVQLAQEILTRSGRKPTKK
jgi:hypothetical protein